MTLDTLAARIDPDALADLEALTLERGRPLVVLDCDEVLVIFTAHLARWMEGRGYRLRLTSYQLEGSMFREGEDVPIPFDDCLRLIDGFFTEETRDQAAIPGAVAAAARLGAAFQLVILTNVPRHARDDRVENMRRLGIDAPVVVNAGGKGRPLAWLRAQVDAPVVFVDDSSQQLGSVAKHAPEVGLVHFRGAENVRPILTPSEDAHAVADDWDAAERAIRALIAERSG